MVALALGAVGSAVGGALAPGFAIGGLTAAGLGASFGQAVGGVVDSWLLAPAGSDVEGPRLSDLRVNLSGEGVTVNRVFGTARVPGNVIWATDLKETRRKRRGGKGGGGGSSTTYSYSASLAVGVCEGPIAGLARIWADGKLFWEQGQEQNSDLIAIYTGDEVQTPDAYIEAIEGAGQVPGWRGLAYVVFKDIPLADYGNRLPNFSFEVLADGEAYALRAGEGLLHGFGQQPHVFRRSAAEAVLCGIEDVAAGQWRFAVSQLDLRGVTAAELKRGVSAGFSGDEVLAVQADIAPDDRHVVISALVAGGGVETLYLALGDLATGVVGPLLQPSPGDLISNGDVLWVDQGRLVLRVFEEAGLDAGKNGVVTLERRGLELQLNAGVTGVFGDLVAPELATGPGFVRLSADHVAVLRRSGDDLQARVLLTGATPLGGVQQLAGGFAGAGLGAGYQLVGLGGGQHVLAVRRDDGQLQVQGFVFGAETALAETQSVRVLSESQAVEQSLAVVEDEAGLVLRSVGAFGGEFLVTQLGPDGGGWSVGLADQALDGAHLVEAGAVVSALAGDDLLVVGETSALMVRSGVTGAEAELVEIAASVLGRAGLQAGEMNLSALSGLAVTGYVIDRPSSARRVLEPLLAFGPHDLVESGGAVVARPFADEPVWWVAAGDEQAGAAGAAREPSLIERRPVSDLPREVTVSHQDPARDYQSATQRATRDGAGAMVELGAVGRRDVALPVVAGPETMKRLAENELFAAWARRETLKVSLPREALVLEPGDVMARDGELWRVTNVRLAGQQVDVEALPADPGLGQSAAEVDETGFEQARTALAVRPALDVLELPPLPGFGEQVSHVAAVLAGDGFAGGTVMRSLDGVNFVDQDSVGLPAVAGVVLEPPGSAAGVAFDNASVLRVRLVEGELESRSRGDVLNGANLAILGDEVIQFSQAVEVATNEWELSGLLRGRAGTEAAIAGHVAGERFVLLEPDALVAMPFDASLLGQDLSYRLDLPGAFDAGAGVVRVRADGLALQPLSPVHGRVVRDGSGDAVISWTRRTRINGGWTGFGGSEGTEPPLGEAFEQWRVDVLDGSGDVVRSFENEGAEVSYSAAQQVADFGAVQLGLRLRVRQVSAVVGPGTALEFEG